MAQAEALSNPYVAGSPVSRPEMFFGRSDVFEFVRSALVGQHQDNIIVLYGKRRTGKTSVLYQMHRNLDPRYLPILIDLQALTMDSLSGFFFEVASTIRRALNREYQIEIARPRREDFESDPLGGFQETFMNQVAEGIGERRLLLMIDEAARLDEQVQAGKLTPDIFGHVRSLMQHNSNLNFMFSIGERLETMQSQYAMLFNVALYKEISFLDEAAAKSLIVQPAEGLFSYDEPAIQQIIRLTSGHAYFMQLLCHSIFAQWQRESAAAIGVKDVDGVAAEVVERGSANLKFDWDESLPVEKLVLGAMAEAINDNAASVTLKDVDEVLARYDILIPQGDIVSAHRSLIGKELVFGAEQIRFAIDFLRLWVREHEKMEWIKEELSTEIAELREIAEAELAAEEARASKKKFRWGLLVASVATVVALLLFVPGSPARVFEAGVPEEVISVVASIPVENRCGTLSQTETLGLGTCVDSVEKLSNRQLRFNVFWTAAVAPDLVLPEGFEAGLNRAPSKIGDLEPFLQDQDGNSYHFTEIGGTAAVEVSATNLKATDIGWFQFPQLPDGVTSVAFVDRVSSKNAADEIVDVIAEMKIENIDLAGLN